MQYLSVSNDKPPNPDKIGYRDRGVLYSVRMEGLEPTHLSALDPKSSASTNFATSANGVQRKQHFYTKAIFFVYL